MPELRKTLNARHDGRTHIRTNRTILGAEDVSIPLLLTPSVAEDLLSSVGAKAQQEVRGDTEGEEVVRHGEDVEQPDGEDRRPIAGRTAAPGI